MSDPPPSTRRLRGALAIVAAVLAALALAACSTTSDEGEDLEQATDEARTTPSDQDADRPLPPAEENGRALFVDSCGACHTLEAAGTIGQIGPNLDDLQADQAQVLKAIRIGGRGSGSMPAGLYEGKQARDVAAFVANNGG